MTSDASAEACDEDDDVCVLRAVVWRLLYPYLQCDVSVVHREVFRRKV
jgi:hypothetical protein